jgi:hypothetical protein
MALADARPVEPACQKPISCVGGADTTRRAATCKCVKKTGRRPVGTTPCGEMGSPWGEELSQSAALPVAGLHSVEPHGCQR